jgi:hypothetical protein
LPSGSESISTQDAEGQETMAAALLSFLKQMRGSQIWTEKDLSLKAKRKQPE